ncbi:MAG: sulfurtransferase TusA family protein [Geothermobacteraceae bacterium]
MSVTRETICIDIRGQICPAALLMALKATNEHKISLEQGRLCLEILTDNRDATVTIPEAVRNMGYNVDVQKAARHYRIVIF